MRRLGIATVMLATTIALSGCKNRLQEPMPGPRAARPPAEAIQAPAASPGETPPAPAAQPNGGHRHGASGISWFQGTVEEAFSTCSKCTTMFWREALDR
jgi:hypothetical protein